MAGIIGNNPIQVGKINEINSVGIKILDELFQKNAILLNDTLTILTNGANLGALGGLGINLPLPLLGFEFKTPQELQLLKYNYSEYPYVDKTLITNAYLRENTSISIIGYRPITYSGNGGVNVVNNLSSSVLGIYTTNELITSTLKIYCDKGGTFSLLTLWGQIQNLVLEELAGVPLEAENALGGQAFLFRFKQINYPKQKNQAIKTILSKMTMGVL